MKTVLAFQDITRLTDITLQHNHYMDKIKIIMTTIIIMMTIIYLTSTRLITFDLGESFPTLTDHKLSS